MATLVFTARLIKKRPLRSFLTVVQIALGVWLMVTILTMNFTANEQVNQVFGKLGDDIARISMQKETIHNGQHLYEVRSFTQQELSSLKEDSQYIEVVFSYSETWESYLRYAGTIYSLRGLTQASAEFIPALNLQIVEGFAFTSEDEQQKNRVALISADLKKQLFPNESAIGQVIELQRYSYSSEAYLPFEIIGVYEPYDPLLQLFFSEATVLIPNGSMDTAEYQYFGGDVFIKSRPGAITAAIAEAQSLIRNDDFEVHAEYFSELGSMYSRSIYQLTLLYSIFAFIALVISSIGILSIMLVNVVERTREIGLRKALGASKLSILIQVLNESLIFSLLGAFLGIVVSTFSSRYITSQLIMKLLVNSKVNSPSFHPLAALISCGVAVMVAVIFGLYPAIQAARMPAVDALRDA